MLFLISLILKSYFYFSDSCELQLIFDIWNTDISNIIIFKVFYLRYLEYMDISTFINSLI